MGYDRGTSALWHVENEGFPRLGKRAAEGTSAATQINRLLALV